MSNRVVFEEPEQKKAPIPPYKFEPPTMGDWLLKAKVIGGPSDVVIILGIFALFLFAASFYIVASAVSPSPTLGEDILRPGERAPSYVSE